MARLPGPDDGVELETLTAMDQRQTLGVWIGRIVIGEQNVEIVKACRPAPPVFSRIFAGWLFGGNCELANGRGGSVFRVDSILVLRARVQDVLAAHRECRGDQR